MRDSQGAQTSVYSNFLVVSPASALPRAVGRRAIAIDTSDHPALATVDEAMEIVDALLLQGAVNRVFC